MQKVYQRINWENYPSTETPINEANLNRIDSAVDTMDNRIISMDVTKVDHQYINSSVKNWTMDEETGIITIEKYDGSKIYFDLNIEKIPVDFELSDDGILTMTTADGEVFTANIGAMIPVLTFEDSDDIAVSYTGSGVNRTYSFTIKNGAITADKLQPNYLADITVQAENAAASALSSSQYAESSEESATDAEAWAVGQRNGVDVPETDETYHNNSKYWKEQAQSVSHVDIATTTTAGIVKPDGVSILVQEDGTISAIGGVTGVKGDAESEYRAGNVNITKENIGLGNVDNTADENKNVSHALTADSDAGGNNIQQTYAASLDVNSDNELELKSQSGEVLSSFQMPYDGKWLGEITFNSETGNAVTVFDESITSDSIIDIYWADESKEEVMSIGVSYVQGTGGLTITLASVPEDEVKISNIKVVNP